MSWRDWHPSVLHGISIQHQSYFDDDASLVGSVECNTSSQTSADAAFFVILIHWEMIRQCVTCLPWLPLPSSCPRISSVSKVIVVSFMVSAECSISLPVVILVQRWLKGHFPMPLTVTNHCLGFYSHRPRFYVLFPCWLHPVSSWIILLLMMLLHWLAFLVCFGFLLLWWPTQVSFGMVLVSPLCCLFFTFIPL